ncbi:GAF domain-containing protein [Halomonas sp. FME1]|uniref:histidine kinase n=1 Tax=Halomonas casei TaxID=2742613 RepID=A0ABR9F0G9_9GAMM|nr:MULTISPECIES: GAF domain-containing protein [Halomonas]MBE0399307.1 GAF domain-containing protein [Halomonas casei]PCC21800.1 histidine kinase [Halomonas sp. JB37]
MQAPDTPHNETQRLAALHALHVLDTPKDQAFERMTQLARDLFDVPIALVSLVDKERQWFKSHQGLDACETSRELSFCAHAIYHETPLVIEDTLKDKRFFDNPLVNDAPHIRFYAGYPLRPLNGMAAGTLCLIDSQPRPFSERDLMLLGSLAAQVEELLRQHKRQVELTRIARSFEALFTKSATAKIRIDRSGHIAAINPFALNLLGYTENELIGQNIAVLTPPDISIHHDRFIADYLAGGEPKVIGRGREVEALHKDGRRIPVHLAINAIHNDQGRVVEFLGVLTDLTEIYDANRRIRKEENLLKILHQGITDYQALMSGERLWTFLMEALRELTDSDYALIGEVMPTDTTNALKIHAMTDLSWSEESKHLMEKLRSGDMTLTNPNSLLGRVFASGEVIMTNDVYRHTKRGGFPAGHPRINNYLGVPIVSGDQLIGMFAIANSKQPLNQALLDWLQPFTDTCALLINLYRQMAEREQVTSDLASARDLAEKANQAKSEFLSSMSHELRTPLNAIIGFSQLLGKARRDPLSDKQQRQVGQIEKSGQHLLSLINEVLDLARIEAGHVQFSIEPILMQNVLDDVCSTLEATIEAAGITLTSMPFSEPWYVAADYTRTKQVLLNLLSNAIKYNHQHGTIRIAAEPLDDELRISIIDSGTGIAIERQHELFEPFNRLDAEHGSIEGTGIGLAITRELVERMQGRIGMTSHSDVGSTFWFTLPITERDASEEQPSAFQNAGANASHQHQFQLLYIEDNPANQRLMDDIIEEFSHIRLQTVVSAELGLEIMRHAPPDLVLMDIHLPGMNGFQALDIMQKDPQLKHIKVIALSANAMERDRSYGLAAGFNDYLTKPIDIEKLTLTLNHFLYTAATKPWKAP